MKAKILAKSKPTRQGTLLPMVLVVIVMLTLGGYSYTEQMMMEMESTVMFAREVQARAMADSGVELTLEMLTQREAVGVENLYHNPAVFQQTLLESQIARGNARFSVVAPIESNPSATRPRLGLMNESGKININELPNLTLEEDEVRLILSGGPESLIMTVEMADVILDYIDAEQPAVARAFGSEVDTNKNAPLESLDELLTIEGVTREMLYGEDANQNGMLDPGEDLNGDGIFQAGWTALLTVHSMESNLRADGTAKTNLNQSLLTELYDAVNNEFDEDKAKFIVAYRMNGPVATTTSTTGGTSGTSSTSGSSSSAGGSGGGTATNVSGTQSGAAVVQAAASAVAKAVTGTAAGSGTVTRGGMDLSGAASVQFSSLYELIGSQVTATVNGESTTLDSPWTNNPSDMLQYLPILMDTFSLTDDTAIFGRVNINQARYETLIGLPGMTATLANYITSQQMIDSKGQPQSETIAQHGTTGWLLMNGQVDLPTMQALDQFITARGEVFRAQVIGHFDAGGPVCRLEAIIDATTLPPKLVQLRDLTDLGRGFSHAQLLQQQ